MPDTIPWLTPEKEQKLLADGSINLTWLEGKKILQTAERRITEQPERKFPIQEILYNGEWWQLCRTDLCDDICTFRIPMYSVEEALASDYRYGIRFKDNNGFAVIDSTTDG